MTAPHSAGVRKAVAGVLLAAGASTRMGGAAKLLLPVAGRPMVRASASVLLEAGLSPVMVVLGWRAREVQDALAGLTVQVLRNPDFRRGMGSSLAAGVAALGPDVTTAVVALADMPWIRPETVRALLEARRDRGIAVPVFQGRRGHPVVFDLTRYRGALTELEGDRGARSILRRNPGDVVGLAVSDPGVLCDVDTPEDYAAVVEEDRGAEPSGAA